MVNQETELASALKSMPSLRRRHFLLNGVRAEERRSYSTKTDHIESTSHSSPHIVDTPKVPIRHPHETIKHFETTIFDSPEWKGSNAFGMWIQAWTFLTLFSILVLSMNFLKTGYPLDTKILGMMFKNINVVAIIDLAMYLSMYVTYFIQVLVSKGYLNWNNYGWILQYLWQLASLFTLVSFTMSYDLAWIPRIFLVLHCISMIMQQHSYAYYNSHLYGINRELEVCLSLYQAMDKPDKESSESLELVERIAFCKKELNNQSETIRYPDNITLSNFFMFTLFPTLVYQIEYPRTNKIRWGYLLIKVWTIFHVIFLMILHVEQYLYPTLIEALELRNSPRVPQLQDLAELFIKICPSITFMFLVTFYLIWDAILNSIAELTCFGDRNFYGDWWNTRDWDMFLRQWNIPVHHFFLRHVYYASISNIKLTKFQAKLFTFIVSALLHELCMYVMFRRLRGYMFVSQFLQIPLGVICHFKFVKDRPALAIANFWFGLNLSPSLVIVLYFLY